MAPAAEVVAAAPAGARVEEEQGAAVVLRVEGGGLREAVAQLVVVALDEEDLEAAAEAGEAERSAVEGVVRAAVEDAFKRLIGRSKSRKDEALFAITLSACFTFYRMLRIM